MSLVRQALLVLSSAFLCASASAQDPARGARLYLGLPGGEASCVECHGPDPSQDRNRLLNAARGPAAIDEALRKAAAMGYLAELLSATDRANLSAFLALVNADNEGGTAATVWPWVLEFGRVAPGSAAAPQAVRLHNRGSVELPLAPRLRSLAAGGTTGLTLTHDCPTALAPGAACTAQVGLVAGAEGRIQAVLTWQDTDSGAGRPVGVAATVTSAAAGAGQWADDAAAGAVLLSAAPSGTATALLTLHNAGRAPLTLGVPAISGPGRTGFRLEPGGCAANLVLPVGGRCSVRLVATAPASGRLEALLQWRNDGTHAPARQVVVQADGLGTPAPPAPTPPPTPAPTPSPAPAPTPQPEPASTGGCSSVAWPQGQPDPVLPALVIAACLAMRQRKLASAA